MIQPQKEFWEKFKKIEGALSCTEAVAIINIVKSVPTGVFLELGVFKGKSACSAAYGGECIGFELVEPEFEKTIPTKEVAENIGAVSKAAITLAFIVGYSTDYLKNTNQMYSYVFLDSGNHQDGLPMAEVRLLEDRIVPGGILAFHDYKSQFKEVAEAYNYLLSTGKYEEIEIDWREIIEYVRNNDLEKGNISWHHNELEFPCFLGALKRK